MKDIKKRLESIREEAQNAINKIEKSGDEATDATKETMNSIGERLENAVIDLRKQIDPNYSGLEAAKDKIVNKLD